MGWNIRIFKRFNYIEETFEVFQIFSDIKNSLFRPIYFGLDSLLIIIMNEWAKRKKNIWNIKDEEEEGE